MDRSKRQQRGVHSDISEEARSGDVASNFDNDLRWQRLGDSFVDRPFASARIEELEAEFDSLLTDKVGLKLLHAELARRRSTPRVQALSDRVWSQLRSPSRQQEPPITAADGAHSQSMNPPDPLPLSKERIPLRPAERSFLEQTIARLRDRLIDISKKSPLIAFKHSERGATYLRIIDETLDGLFDGLRDGQMSFEPLPDPEAEPEDQKTPNFKLALEGAYLTDEVYLAEIAGLGEREGDADRVQKAEQGLVARVRDSLGLPAIAGGKRADPVAIARANNIDPSFDLPLQPRGPNHTDDRIRVLLLPDKLDGRLRTILDRYRGHAAQTGIHTLQLVFGFIEWREPGSETAFHHAPLLTMPMHLRQETRRGKIQYALSGEDENLSANIAAQEMLRRNFGVVLPDAGADEGPETYIARIAPLVEDVDGLKLRRFATLAVLPFPNMAIWRDLDPDAWPNQSLLEHEQTGILLGARETDAAPSAFPPDHAIETLGADVVPPLVLEADVSQHSALLDVAGGHSLALEGPPGAGKSQTIANMIAGALSQNKRVLFVAEKLAALKVVSARLDALGFGPLTLEIHSDRSTKLEVIDSLRKALTLKQQPQHALKDAAVRATAMHDDLTNRRDILRLYRMLLRRPLGALNLTVADLIWREMRLRAVVESGLAREVWDRPVIEAETISAFELERAREVLEAIERTAEAIATSEGGPESPWRNARAIPPTPIGQSDVQGRLISVEKALAELDGWAREVLAVSPSTSPRIDALSAVLSACVKAPAPAALPTPLLKAALADPEQFEKAARLLETERAGAVRVAAAFDGPSSPDVDALQASVTAIHAAGMQSGSLDRLKALLAQSEEQLTNLQSAENGRRAASDLALDLDALLPAQLGVLAQAVKDLATTSEDLLALRSEGLVRDDAGPLLKDAAQEAAGLRQRRAELPGVRWAALASLSPSDLASAAAAMESTPAILRGLSGGYKSARGLVSQVLEEIPNDGKLAAAKVRSAMALGSELELYRSGSAAASLFQVGWKGCDSDFDACTDLRAKLRDVDLRLRREGLEIAPRLFAVSTSQLRLWSEAFERVRLKDAGVTGAPIAQALAAAEHRVTLLSAAIAAVEAARARDVTEVSQSLVDEVVAWSRDREALQAMAATSGWLNDVEMPADLPRRAADWGRALQKAGAGPALVQHLKSVDGPAAESRRLSTLLSAGTGFSEALKERWDAFARSCEAQAKAFLGPLALEGTDIAVMLGTVRAALADGASMRLYADLGRDLREAERQRVLWLYDAVVAEQGPPWRLADAYELAVIRSILRDFLRADGQDLERLGGTRLEDAGARFRDLDARLAKLEALRILADRATDRVPRGRGIGPKSDYTDLALVEHELSKQKRHIPVRELFLRAHSAVQVLKPVWMMSPTTVAQFSPPSAARFDLVIIDEASQMTPEMAVGALARGAQIVVVGDPKQLPPYDQFKVAIADGDDDDGVDVEAESILDLAFAKVANKRRLKWHYRSQHERLIQFSNREFYDQELVIFPSAITGDDYLGVRSEFVGGLYQARVNPKEAEAVIEAAVGLMAARPELSLGIVAMNADQRELIFQTFEDMKAQQRLVRDYVQRWEGGIEEFFIKTLENVQGDERDVIIVSTLYGPAEVGGKVAQRFGLLVRKDGHRRLNVLMTRAKRANWIFTSMRPSDVVVGPTSSRGVQSFQRMLAYADGAPTTDRDSGHDLAEPESDFEQFVAERLRAHGYEVVYQVGVDRYRIDLGIRHEAYPGGFLAGIECDGASYHSSFTVRDRDRIRQAVLERLGWRIWRVWSTDWFNDPERELGRLLQWLDGLRDEALARQLKMTEALAEAETLPALDEGDDDSADLIEEIMEDRRAEPADPPPPSVPTAGAAEALAPSGRRHLTPEGHAFYEVAGVPGLYEVWLGERMVGTVERVAGATGPARLFGGQVLAPKPQFVAETEDTGERHVTDDLYRAVRKIVEIAGIPAVAGEA